jgi:hypothetical protein
VRVGCLVVGIMRDRIKMEINEMECEVVDWIDLAVVGSCENGNGPWGFVNSISRAIRNLSSKITPFHGMATLFL